MSPLGKSPFLCKKEVSRNVEGAFEGDCMTVQEYYKKEALPVGWPAVTPKRTSHVQHTGLLPMDTLNAGEHFAPTETAPYLYLL